MHVGEIRGNTPLLDIRGCCQKPYMRPFNPSVLGSNPWALTIEFGGVPPKTSGACESRHETKLTCTARVQQNDPDSNPQRRMRKTARGPLGNDSGPGTLGPSTHFCETNVGFWSAELTSDPNRWAGITWPDRSGFR